MAAADDIAALARFNEATALSVGMRIRQAAEAEGLAVVIDIRLWDRPLFYLALQGTSADNVEWVRRKANVVRRLGISSYRFALELDLNGRSLAERGLDPVDFAAAGGAFPIRIDGVGVVGAVTVSGVPMRQDHALVVAALAAELGHDAAALALPESQTQNW